MTPALTPAQRMMVEDGLPAEMILPPETRGRPGTRERTVPAPAPTERAPAETEEQQPGPEAQTQESEVKKPAKAKKPTRTERRARSASAADAQKQETTKSGPKVNVVQAIADMMARPEGASMDEMVAATGIAAHPMRAKIKLVRDRLGYKTEAPCKANEYRYHATPPKKRKPAAPAPGFDGDEEAKF